MSSDIQSVRPQPKLDETCLRLGSMAAALEPGTRLPKVVDLCRQLDVSVDTLGKALTRLEAEGVLKRKHGLGIFTNQRHKHTIFLICDPALFSAAHASPFWPILLDHLKERAQDTDELLSLHFAKVATGSGVHLDRHLMQDISQRRMDGVMVLGLNDETTRWIIEQGIKTVGYASKASHRVRTDHAAQIVSSVEVLAHAGCKRIAYWGGIHSGRVEDVVLAREEGYLMPLQTALKSQGLDFFPELVQIPFDLVNERTGAVEASLREQGFRMAQRVFTMPRLQWPDGIVIGNDVTTLGALVAFSKMGVCPGQDVLVASHANLGSSALYGYEEDLATIAFDPDKIVRVMFELMQTILSGHTPKETIVYVAPEKPRLGKEWNIRGIM